jgi:hypothetical protein
MKRYLYTQEPVGPKRLRPDRSEFLVYLLLRRRLESGDIFCRESVRFRSFEDDLLDDQRWQEKDALIATTDSRSSSSPSRSSWPCSNSTWRAVWRR